MPRALTVKFCFQRSSTDKARRSTAYWICAPMKVRSSARRLVPGITNRYCSPSFETATSWPPQEEVSLVETQQPHAEERATRASRSMGSKRHTHLSSSVLVPRVLHSPEHGAGRTEPAIGETRHTGCHIIAVGQVGRIDLRAPSLEIGTQIFEVEADGGIEQG